VDLLQGIDSQTAFFLAVGCVLLCGVGIVLFLGLQIIGGIFEIFSSVLSLFFDILGGGPLSWCGCLLFIVLCVGCVGLTLLGIQALSTCGTQEAVNLCRLIGG
jgi:hypothetical protein